jgi:hypothetical protein
MKPQVRCSVWSLVNWQVAVALAIGSATGEQFCTRRHGHVE